MLTLFTKDIKLTYLKNKIIFLPIWYSSFLKKTSDELSKTERENQAYEGLSKNLWPF
jgi:hypothetical protein